MHAPLTLAITLMITLSCTINANQAASDTKRIPLIKSIKTEGVAWVSKYARGGSARSQSARRCDGRLGVSAPG